MSTAMIFQQLAGGMLKSISIFCWTLLFSLPLGLLITFGRMSNVKLFGRFRVVRGITKLYIDIMRGTPLMLQLMVVYYGPYFLWRADIGGFRYPAIILAFSINYAAYFAEIFRGGIESIPRGQYEAAAALGMTKAQTFFRIILPQVIKRIVPASSNEVITLVKDTSLANVVAYSEIMLAAKQQMMNYSSLVPLFIAGVFYFVMATVLTALFGFIEKKLNYYR